MTELSKQERHVLNLIAGGHYVPWTLDNLAILQYLEQRGMLTPIGIWEARYAYKLTAAGRAALGGE